MNTRKNSLSCCLVSFTDTSLTLGLQYTLCNTTHFPLSSFDLYWFEAVPFQKQHALATNRARNGHSVNLTSMLASEPLPRWLQDREAIFLHRHIHEIVELVAHECLRVVSLTTSIERRVDSDAFEALQAYKARNTAQGVFACSSRSMISSLTSHCLSV